MGSIRILNPITGQAVTIDIDRPQQRKERGFHLGR